MKNKHRSDKKTKILAAASAGGALAVCAGIVAVYSAAVKNLVPTGVTSLPTFSSSSAAFSSSTKVSDIPANKPISNVPVSSSSSQSRPSQSSSSSEENTPVNKPSASVKGNIFPVRGDIDVSFSNGELVKSVTLGVWKTHDGIDILCDLGTEVKSMSDGVVREIKNDPLYGVCVVVEQENGLEVHYYGLAKELEVKAGSEVKQGAIIGRTSDTNQSEILQKPHLHLGVKRAGKWVDPVTVIK